MYGAFTCFGHLNLVLTALSPPLWSSGQSLFILSIPIVFKHPNLLVHVSVILGYLTIVYFITGETPSEVKKNLFTLRP
jgi:hypothetical protein